MNKKLIGFFLVPVLVSTIVLGCSKEEAGIAEPSAPDSVASQDLPESVPSSIPELGDSDGNFPVVTFRGGSVTRAEVDATKDRMLQQYQGRIPDEQLKSMEDGVWKTALDNLIKQRLLLAAADEAGAEVDTAALEEQIAGIKSRFPSPEDFQKMLDSMQSSEELMRKELSDNMKIQNFLDSRMADLGEPTAEEVRAYYDENSAQFTQPEQVRASHILIATKPENTEEELAEKRKKLEGILEEVRNGADFAELAKQHSEGPSAPNGGDLNFFQKGQMVQPFDQEAFALKEGEVSGIVKTQFGFHIIKKTGQKEAGTQSFESVSEQITSQLGQLSKKKFFDEYMEELMKSADVQYEEGYQP